LQDELIRTKCEDTTACKAGYYSAQSARESLHSLRVSLNRSLILPHIEVDSEEEMEVDEEDVHELRDQINKLHSSSKDTFDDFMDAESGDDTPCPKEILKISEEDDQSIIDDIKSPLQDNHKEVKDPTLCSSPKIHSKARKSITLLALKMMNLMVQQIIAQRRKDT
jgi:kinesin family member 15